MNGQLLIDSMVRQMTVLIAQLATTGGVRAPLAHVANQVFLELAEELDAQGVSRKVSADMFGMALRAYIRKVRRLSGSKTDRGQTLWQAVLQLIETEDLVTRKRVLERFRVDGELQVSAVLRDLTDSGLVFCAGTGPDAVFRAASDAELGRMGQLPAEGLDDLLCALLSHHRTMTAEELVGLVRRSSASVEEALERLVADGRVSRDATGRLFVPELIVPLGAPAGWEASVFDHFQAVVRTICQRLATPTLGADDPPVVGGSTYTFDLWRGHPLEDEVLGQLQALRDQLGALRQRVAEHNEFHEAGNHPVRIITYVGQSVTETDGPAQDGDTEA